MPTNAEKLDLIHRVLESTVTFDTDEDALDAIYWIIQGGIDPFAEDDPRCICGVHQSEHALCGCEHFEVAS